jgi:hypothetical protein
MIRSALVVAVLASVVPLTAWSFEPGPTHPGLTARAVVRSRLHDFLRKECGWQLGLFEQLRLDQSQTSRRRYNRLTRDLRRLDPAGGYRPDEKTGGLRAVAWSLAGSVLAQRPASRGRHHFFCPSLKNGLDDRGPLVGSFLALIAMLEGSDTVREFFTGTGFDLTGKPAPAWASSKDNDLSVPVLYDQLARSVTAESPDARRHHLALALLAMGGVLHVLQDMASPTHARNDFRVGHLQRLGSSSFDRGSAFERFVAERYGQFGLPRYGGKPVEKRRIRDFFSNKGWTGLADITSVSHFSPGTLPPPTLVLPDTDPGELRRRLAGKLRLRKPVLGPIDLRCARRAGHNRRCHVKGPHGPLLAYHIDDERRLRFTLDRSCHAAAARHLLPLAIGYSAGLINHLLRGRVELTWDDDAFALRNTGAAIKEAKGELYAEDEKGRRTRMRQLELALPAKTGDTLANFSLAPPHDAVALVVLVRGEGFEGDPLVATIQLDLTRDKVVKAK